MSILILKNFATEGPGTIEDFLVQNNMHYTVVDIARHAVDSGDGFDTLIMLGGPMSVNDEDKYPYLTDEMKLAEQFMKAGKRVFGICLGAQLMAKALGAKVYPGPEKEIGWYDIELRDAGSTDPRMAHLATDGRNCKVFQWHGETFDIPQGAERLAMSGLYPNQAFRYGNSAYAFQFHIEVSKQMIFDWLKHEPVDMKKIEQETAAYYAGYAARAQNFYKVFFLAG
ncbi:MAG: type 1 glutamine amidotransferase [Nitrospirae bacterium]|nr:type 1 glutamine amidotransferase [Nitrospirota bacterium]